MQYSALTDAEKQGEGTWDETRAQRCRNLTITLGVGLLVGCLASAFVLTNQSNAQLSNAQNFMSLYGDKLDEFDIHPADLEGTTMATALGNWRITQGKMYGIAPSPLKRLVLTMIDLTSQGDQVRDVTVKAKLTSVMSTLNVEATEQVKDVTKAVSMTAAEVKDMAGVSAPFGLFDPLGLSLKVPAGSLLYFREAELKHGRIGMMACLGMYVGETWHPFAGNSYIDTTSVKQVLEVQTSTEFWFTALALSLNFEYLYSLGGDQSKEELDKLWLRPGIMNPNRVPGDLGWDPLNLKPKDPKDFKSLQTKELNNGRLAMLAAGGIIAQELVTGKKVF